MSPRTNKAVILITAAIFAITPGVAMSMNNASPDPFIKTWQNFDGVNKYFLSITKSSAPGQSYSVNYTYPTGNTDSDFCNATSATSISCTGGFFITRDDKTYSIKVTDYYGDSYIYYDPNHMPTIQPIFGIWKYQNDIDGVKSYFTVTISRGPTDHQYVIETDFKDSRGDLCGSSTIKPNLYEVVKNTDGSQILTKATIEYDGSPVTYEIKYDPAKMQLINPHVGSYSSYGNFKWKVGECLYMNEGSINSSPIPVAFAK